MREEGDHDGTGEDPAVSRDCHVAGEARIVIFNLGRPNQDTEDPREPVKFPQATGEFTIFSVLPQFHELPHGAAIFPPHSFQLLHDGLAFAFPKSENTDAVLVRKARADGMQG